MVHIPGHLSFIRTINLPPMPKGELKEAVKWEIKRQLPYPQEEAVYDYIAAPAADGIVVTFASAERKMSSGIYLLLRKPVLRLWQLT